MTARFASFLACALAGLAVPAQAQTAAPPASPAPVHAQPQTPPNPGAAEAQPSTVTGPGGVTTAPASGSQGAPAVYGPDPGSGNQFTRTPPLGPQQNLGHRINGSVRYVAGDYIAPPLVYDAFAGPSKGTNYRSFAARAAFEIPLGQNDVYVGGESRSYTYRTRGGLVTGVGPAGAGFAPSFTAREYDYDVRTGFKVTGPRVYAAVSYLTRGGNVEPRQHGVGYGIEKLADVDQNFSLHGNVFFYPNVNGRYAFGGAGSFGISYREVRYLIGASIQPNRSPVFLDAGFLGDRSHVRTDAPVGFNHQGPYVGLGLHF